MKRTLIVLSTTALFFISCQKQSNVAPPHIVTPPHELVNQKDISYGKGLDYSGQEVAAYHTLDIYFPPGAANDKRYPLFFYIHAGGFLIGDKGTPDASDICNDFAKAGYVAVSVNYRLGYPNSGNPGDCTAKRSDQQKAIYRALQDANAAMRFVINKADEYGIDKNNIFAGGASAGAITALNMVYCTQAYCNSQLPGIEQELGGLSNSVNSITQNFTIKGVSNGWGVISDSTLITASNAVPTISFHGTDDNVCPPDNGHFLSCSNYPAAYGSINIHRQLSRLGKPVITHLLSGGGHGPDEYKNPFYSKEAICFFDHIMSGESISSGIYHGMKSGCK